MKYIVLYGPMNHILLVRGWYSNRYDDLFKESFDSETDSREGPSYLPEYFLFGEDKN